MTAIDPCWRRFDAIPLVSRPRRVGVYVLMRGDVPVYVGMSHDIHSRIEHHLAGSGSVQLTRSCFDRALCLDLPAEALADYEGALIRALRPRYNLAAPAHRGRDNELLASIGFPTHVDENAAKRAWVLARRESLAARDRGEL